MAVQSHVVPGCTALNMKAIFRADASLQIGTGHVMRCLTLADALAGAGASCEFICREHPGHLIDFIRHKGYVIHVLPMAANGENTPRQPGDAHALAHHHWLGATQTQDAETCAPLLAERPPDWLVVDHYALDARWESVLAPHSRRLMVIDDLADRPHACDLLLDQTFGRDEHDYRALVPAHSRLLCGSQYALLRPEFAALRPYSLRRRAHTALRELFITMGGVDQNNATGQVLHALGKCALPADCRLTVVMGATAPWLDAVKTQALDMPWPTEVLVGVSNMAQLMADSDLAIGAAGATSFERCCLGLPSLMIILADNQRDIGTALQAAGAAQLIEPQIDLEQQIAEQLRLFAEKNSRLRNMSVRAAEVTHGNGTRQVCEAIAQMALESAP